MSLINHNILLLRPASDRCRDKNFEDKYLSLNETISAIAYMQFTGLSKRAASDIKDYCRSVLKCADHVIVEMLFRSEQATGVRADLWSDETSAEALARRDFIHSRVDAKVKPLVAARTIGRSRY
ncbi:MAG: hypothetical protein V7763_02805 [Sulfitobacter sp.]